MTGTSDRPATVRLLDSPAARALAELAAMLDDLQTVLACCERLMTELGKPEDRDDGVDELLLESLWTTALLSYTRCFTGGRNGVALTEDDVTATGLQGEVLQWHNVLRTLRKHYADPAVNPRERFSVGAAQDTRGRAGGIAITSTRRPALDEVTVRQTGALAYALSQLVDRRIEEHQQRVRETANALSAKDLNALPRVDLTTT